MEVYRAVTEMSVPGGAYYAMVGLSTIIASYGLLADSIAVVIGAMLVAPLMGPIFGVALGLEAGDKRLLRTSALSELAGIVLAVGLSALIGLLPLRLAFGHEILARTQPTLYDIIIALASGFAGAYALVDERISPALPGVAIATSLVPPLATTGLCLATGRWELALGAILLFVANFLAIELAASVVMGICGMGMAARKPGAAKVSGFARRFAWSIAALTVMGVYMTGTLTALITENRLHKGIQTVLSTQIATTAGAQLSQVDVKRKGKEIEVMATALTPSEFEPPQVADMEDALRRDVNPHIHLIMRSLISKDADNKGPVFRVAKEAVSTPQQTEEAKFLTEASHLIEGHINEVPGARLIDLRREDQGGRTVLVAVVRTPLVIEPHRVKRTELALRQMAGKPVRLVVRSVPVWDSDAQGYVVGTEQALAGQLQTPRAKLERRLRQALGRQVPAQVAGAQVLSLRVAEDHGRIEVVVAVRTPVSFTPEQVAAIEGTLRKYVRPNIDLLVRSLMGAYTSDKGYPADLVNGAVGGP